MALTLRAILFEFESSFSLAREIREAPSPVELAGSFSQGGEGLDGGVGLYMAPTKI